jgi:hypothetical protein
VETRPRTLALAKKWNETVGVSDICGFQQELAAAKRASDHLAVSLSAVDV